MNVVNKIVILEESQDIGMILSENGAVNMQQFPVPHNGIRFNHENGLIIDKAAYNVYLNGAKISFPKKQFELLLLLASNPRKVFKRDEILNKIWSKDYNVKDSRSLDVHI